MVMREAVEQSAGQKQSEIRENEGTGPLHLGETMPRFNTCSIRTTRAGAA